MNSDLMPSPESSNSNASQEAEQTTASPEVEKNMATSAANNPAVPVAEPENSQTDQEKPSKGENYVSRIQPIPPPSEPMQYRAIGLVRGRYQSSSEQFTQGSLLTTENTELDAVLLGRIMSLVKNHLDLEKEHLWVVYPRTRQENDKLHVQIVGVWEPENLAKSDSEISDTQDESQDELSVSENSPDDNKDSLQAESKATDVSETQSSSEILDGNFSIRGEVVYQSQDANNLVIKIKQAPRKASDKPKYFKLKILGNLEGRAVGKFWDLEVKREADNLVVEKGQAIADLPRKRKPKRPGFNNKSRKPFRKSGGGGSPRPMKKDTSSGVSSRPNPNRPAPPKPVKRQKPPE
ncbi:MAG: hypothetical protein AAF378_07190 [Cyanobacteria bacterium P01_A01_bin.84]